MINWLKNKLVNLLMGKMFFYKFPRPSVTATIVIVHDGKILLGKRSADSDAYPNYWCVPGGFLDAMYTKNDNNFNNTSIGETIEMTAIREVKEETNLTITENDLILKAVFSDPTLDPRCHVVNICYLVFLNDISDFKAGDDLQEIKMVDYNDLKNYDLAFNHAGIIERVLQ